MIPCRVGNLEQVDMTGTGKDNGRFETGIRNVAAALEKIYVSGRKRKIQAALGLGDFSIGGTRNGSVIKLEIPS